MLEENMTWKEINLKNVENIFDYGSNVVYSHSSKNFLSICRRKANHNDYFSLFEINLENSNFESVFELEEGPRFRITKIVSNECETQECFYFFGGIIAIDRESSIYLNDFWSFEKNTKLFKKIETVGERVSPRGGHSISFYTLKNKLFVFGGKNEKERFNETFEIDLTSNRITRLVSITNPPIARNNHTALILNNSMFIFGGWDGTKTLNDMSELSLVTSIWYPISYRSEIVPDAVYRHESVCISKDSFLIFGGVNEYSGKFNEIYLFNTKTKQWSISVPSGHYPTARTFHNLCFVDNYLYLFGGFSDKIEHDCYSIRIPENTTVYDQIDTISILAELPIDLDILKNQVTELKIKYEAEVFKNTCKICCDKEINTVFLPCSHRFVCYDCSFKCEGRCPVCKTELKEIIKTFT